MSEVEPTWCTICYGIEIAAEGEPITSKTIELECGHRFCDECTVEALQGYIETADLKMLKCFDSECGRALSESKIRDILTSNGQSELYEKYLRFLK